MSVGEECLECGKIWTQEDEDKLNKEVEASMAVKAFI